MFQCHFPSEESRLEIIVGGLLGQHVVDFDSCLRWQTGADMVETGNLRRGSF